MAGTTQRVAENARAALARRPGERSYASLARDLGFSESRTGRLLRGERRWDAELIEKVALALDVSPLYLLGIEDERSAS